MRDAEIKRDFYKIEREEMRRGGRAPSKRGESECVVERARRGVAVRLRLMKPKSPVIIAPVCHKLPVRNINDLRLRTQRRNGSVVRREGGNGRARHYKFVDPDKSGGTHTHLHTSSHLDIPLPTHLPPPPPLRIAASFSPLAPRQPFRGRLAGEGGWGGCGLTRWMASGWACAYARVLDITLSRNPHLLLKTPPPGRWSDRPRRKGVP